MSGSNGYATRDMFLAATERRYKDVTVGGMKCRIRSLTEGEYSAHQIANLDLRSGGSSEDGIKTSDARLIVLSVVDSSDRPLFTDTDVHRLAYLDAAITAPLAREIRAHCGLSSSVEDAEKNFGTTGEGGSPTSCSGAPAQEPATA